MGYSRKSPPHPLGGGLVPSSSAVVTAAIASAIEAYKVHCWVEAPSAPIRIRIRRRPRISRVSWHDRELLQLPGLGSCVVLLAYRKEGHRAVFRVDRHRSLQPKRQ